MKVLFAGEGGQGIQTAAQILTKAAFIENQHTLYIPNFGVEQRGGTSLAFVVIDQNPIFYPKFEKADILVMMSDRVIDRVRSYVNKTTKVILGPAVNPKNYPAGSPLAAKHFPAQTWNILALGQVNRVAKIVRQENLIKAMDERFARQFKKKPDLRKLDLEALKK